MVGTEGLDERSEDLLEGFLYGRAEGSVGGEDPARERKKEGSATRRGREMRGGKGAKERAETHSSKNSGIFFVSANISSTCCLTTSCSTGISSFTGRYWL